MARVSKADVLREIKNKASTKKLIIAGSSVSTKGRVTTLMKIRPSLLERLDELCLGPTYLILEYAVQGLVDKLENTVEGTKWTLDAADFDPTPADLEKVAAMVARREIDGRQVNRRKVRIS